jgi:hypothetical protein
MARRGNPRHEKTRKTGVAEKPVSDHVFGSSKSQNSGVFRLRVNRKGQEGISPKTTEEAAMNNQKLPPGWDEDQIREVIEHYDAQDEDERTAEIEVAWEAEGMTLMSVPTELVPEIRALLARNQTA